MGSTVIYLVLRLSAAGVVLETSQVATEQQCLAMVEVASRPGWEWTHPNGGNIICTAITTKGASK